MPTNSRLKAIFLILLITVFTNISGQKLTSSPWSRYGLGEWSQTPFSQGWSMGGLGVSLNDPGYLHFQNPASYGWLDLTVFETGIKGTSVLQESQTEKRWLNNTTFSHVAFGLPVTRWWGLSFGLLPYSDVGYRITFTENYTGIGNVSFRYEGSGGINRAYIGNGFKIKNRLGLGFNANFLFGDMVYDRRAIFTSPTTFNSRVREDIAVSDFTFDGGLQYKAQLGEKVSMTLGLSYEAGRGISASRSVIAYTYETVGAFDYIRDTISYTEAEKGKINLPQSFAGGVSITSEKWVAGIEGRHRSWTDLESFGVTDSLQDNFQVTAGVQYTPDKFAISSFFRSMRYRAGLRYTSGRIPLHSGSLDEYGISFGLGIPLRKSLSTLNTGLEVSRRGNLDAGTLQETFIRFNFGITINDKWFVKRKYN